MTPLYHENDFARPHPIPAEQKDVRDEPLKDLGRISHSPYLRLLAKKTQLFPYSENGVTRNRLTHSIEVAEVTGRIGSYLCANNNYLRGTNIINPHILQCSGLTHDIGHPPFGHAGEAKLNELMTEYGGFEGNAQSLRVLGRLETRFTKHLTSSEDRLFGLNLTYRTYASILKYDQQLDFDNGIEKGYYADDADFVESIKRNVIKNYHQDNPQMLKTIECQIMDIADDIAYSTYDLEDAMIVGLQHPMKLLAYNGDQGVRILKDVNDKLLELGYRTKIDITDLSIIIGNLAGLFTLDATHDYDWEEVTDRLAFVSQSYSESLRVAKDRKERRNFCERLISKAVRAVKVTINESNPELSRVYMDEESLLEILVLKALNYEHVIQSHHLKIFQLRSNEVITNVFNRLIDNVALIPSDIMYHHSQKEDSNESIYRAACDCIASMSEQNLLELYTALTTGDELRVSTLNYVG